MVFFYLVLVQWSSTCLNWYKKESSTFYDIIVLRKLKVNTIFEKLKQEHFESLKKKIYLKTATEPKYFEPYFNNSFKLFTHLVFTLTNTNVT